MCLGCAPICICLNRETPDFNDFDATCYHKNISDFFYLRPCLLFLMLLHNEA